MPPKRTRQRSLAPEGSEQRGHAESTSSLRAVGGSPFAAARAIRAESVEAVRGIPWSSTISVPQAYRARGTSIAKTEHRGITLPQLAKLADLVQRVLARVKLHDAYQGNARITWDSVNLYHMNEHFVKPLTSRFTCSFVEMAAEAPQIPTWFVSHWWGTPFHQTFELLNFHTEERALPPDSPYWICTFANNQHDLSELSGELEATPFVRAILSEQCDGTLALLDKGVTTLERIWCVLELHVSTTRGRAEKPHHFFDIAAWLPGDAATYGGHPVPAKPTLRMDLGDGRMKEMVQDESTGGAFPLQVSAKGATIDIVKAQASRPEDRRSILHLIAGTPASQQEGCEPPAHCDAYDEVSANACHMFASGALYRAAVQGDNKELARLLERFPDLKDEGISDGATPLYAAAWKSNLEGMEMLLSGRADPNRQKDDGATPVFVAAQAGNAEALRALLDARADPSLARSGDGVGPLFMAAQKKHMAEMELLLAAGADANALTEKGASPLHLAVQEREAKVAKVLLAGRADPNLANAAGVTPMMMASSGHGGKLMKLLKEAGGSTAKERRPSSAPNDGERPEGEADGRSDAEPRLASSRGASSRGHAILPPPVPPARGASGSRGPPAPRAGAGRPGRQAGGFQPSIHAMGGIVGALGALECGGVHAEPPSAGPRPGAGRRRQ